MAAELRLFKHVLAYTADWTYPILGKVLEGCAGGDSVVGVAYCRVILIAACTANVLVHTQISFFHNP